MNKEAGGGISNEMLYQKIRRGLISTARDISRKYPDADLKYGDRELNGTVAGHSVKIFYEVLRASNGEVAGLPVIVLDGKRYERFYRNVADKLQELIGNPIEASGAKMNKVASKFNVGDYVMQAGYLDTLYGLVVDIKDGVPVIVGTILYGVGTPQQRVSEPPTFMTAEGYEFRNLVKFSPFEIPSDIKRGIDQKARQHMNRMAVSKELVSVAKDIEAAEMLAREEIGKQEDPWLTASEVREMCAGCADKMAKLGLSKIRMSRLLSAAQTWEQCISQAKKNPKVKDAEKLCGWLKSHGPNASIKQAGLDSFSILEDMRKIEKTLQGLRFDILHVLMSKGEWTDIFNKVQSIEGQIEEIEKTSIRMIHSPIPMAASDMTADYPQNVTEKDRKKWREEGKERRKHEGIHPRKMHP